MKDNKFAKKLYQIWNTDSKDKKRENADLIKAFLNFGSETEDNLRCAANIEFGLCKNRTDGPHSIEGLRIKGTNILISDIISFLEDDKIYDYLSDKYQDLSRDQIESALRMATMVLVSLEK